MEEMTRALKTLPPAQRKRYLEALLSRFPVAGQVPKPAPVPAAAPAAPKPAAEAPKPISAQSAFYRIFGSARGWAMDAQPLRVAEIDVDEVKAEGGMAGRIALLVTTAGVTLTGDIPLALLTTSFPAFPHDGPASISDQTLTLVLTRPASIILLAMGIFYLWVYLRHNASDTGKDIPENISAGGGPAGLSE